MGDIVVGTEDVVSNDLVVAMVQQSLIENSIIAASLMNVSQFGVKGNASVSFPRASQNFEVKKKLAKVVAETQLRSYTMDKLDFDQQDYINFIVEDIASVQSAVNLEADALVDAGASMAEAIDIFLYNLMKTGGATNVAFSGVGTKIAQADIVDARQKLKATKIKPFAENIFMAINSEDEASMLKLSDFIDSSKYGSNEPIFNGELGRVCGVKILCSESVTAGKPVMYHKNAVAWGLQLSPTVKSQYNMKNIGMEYLIHQLWGAKILRAGALAVTLNK
jgi:N4-gp56 family major capsid protein